jgi:lipopolysaccharide/colanic/teichoic acid biosynthesis glycosyltransferase
MKRLFDTAVATVALVILAPLLFAIAVMIRVALGRPILFRQVRPGRGAVPFTLIKFRTMRDAYSSTGEMLSDSQRMTRLGMFLRSTSLDELPELWNIVKGEMSLVGPRPLLMEYLPLYSAQQARRHTVRPGITGWAQINGRNAISWADKFSLDVWYVDNRTFLIDLKILALTVVRVLRRNGITADNSASTPKFGSS